MKKQDKGFRRTKGMPEKAFEDAARAEEEQALAEMALMEEAAMAEEAMAEEEANLPARRPNKKAAVNRALKYKKTLSKVLKDDNKLIEIRKLLTDLYDDCRYHKHQQRIKAKDAAKYYYREKPDSAVTGGSRYVAPVVQEKVDDAHTAIMDVLRKIEDDITVKGLDMFNKLTPAEESMVAYLCSVTLFGNSFGESVLSTAVRDCLITGTSALRWRIEEVTDFDMEYFIDMSKEDISVMENNLKKNQVLKITAEAEEDGVDFYEVQIATPRKRKRVNYEHIDFNRIMIDPNATDASDANYLCVRSYSTKAELISSGFDKDTIMGITTDMDYESQVQLNSGVEMIPNWSMRDTQQDRGMDLLQVKEHYVRTSIIDGESKLYRFMECNNTIFDVIEEDEIPVALLRPIPATRTPWGTSYAFKLLSMQDAKTALMRGYIDNIHNANHARYFAVKNMYNKRDLMDNRPGGIVEVDQINAVSPFAYNPLPGGIDNLMAHIETDSDNASGISQEAMGRGENVYATGITATQIQINQSKTDMTLKNLTVGLISGMRRLCRGVYNEHRKITPELKPINDVQLSLEPESARRSKAAEVAGIYQLLSQTPFMTPQFQFSLVKDYLGNTGNAFKIGLLKSVQEIMQAAAQPKPMDQLNMQALQAQVQKLTAESQKIQVEAQKTATDSHVMVQKVELEAAELAQKYNLEESKLQYEMMRAADDTNIRAKELFLKETSVGLEAERGRDVSFGNIVRG